VAPEVVKDKVGRVVPLKYEPAFRLLPPVISQIRQHLIAAQKVWEDFTDTIEKDPNVKLIHNKGFYNVAILVDPLGQAVYSLGKQLLTPYVSTANYGKKSFGVCLSVYSCEERRPESFQPWSCTRRACISDCESLRGSG
jgi:hypothetical protein